MEPIESSETSAYNNALTPETYPKEKKLHLSGCYDKLKKITKIFIVRLLQLILETYYVVICDRSNIWV